MASPEGYWVPRTPPATHLLTSRTFNAPTTTRDPLSPLCQSPSESLRLGEGITTNFLPSTDDQSQISLRFDLRRSRESELILYAGFLLPTT